MNNEYNLNDKGMELYLPPSRDRQFLTDFHYHSQHQPTITHRQSRVIQGKRYTA